MGPKCNADALSSSISDSVGQFTLYGLLKGNKPGFQRTPFMLLWLIDSRNACNTDAIKDGVFGAMMKVSLVNDGPVTMQLDSQSPENSVDAMPQNLDVVVGRL
ncbi:uncharacterized protein LOC129287248 isoform X3 [Prosopis cineraria]|uniref:uncharacterized protein LOC129287013 isoform X3 n=1 Tax=Prosopis cineraria TaxID=364024 RepID=UPI00240FC0B4|nr:uncharacterized protein LOC129287013 isoform X3 [Prosopis cineraria]XP_054779124.1 uncharacterized protein LOC129287013 isoform X3 [Prosopis cineraria]XP_054779125.1 uncharacterized protein LOC129287013 isoform X3 [Prosopis cineraria]XP_054779417.1 uncharacterized protein LOC129287248 isoform X3 [Prosopis cineraria]XP_054779418.1 uncharacterized protein LOC129287248 isoform X3 [Prosopis cineraria]XP_054779419.1 uncharacterized protein LOC129287248 isoform X3 [Prosopis cineraria]